MISCLVFLVAYVACSTAVDEQISLDCAALSYLIFATDMSIFLVKNRLPRVCNRSPSLIYFSVLHTAVLSKLKG